MSRIMNHDDVVIDIKAMLERAEAPITEECCIYRVPFDIRKVNEDAYTPKVVSIGPFHHNCHPRLQNMERHKLIYCNAFLARTQATADSWIRYIEEVEPNFRRCYSDTLEFSKEELVKIIFVDSGFILELFWRYYYREWSKDDMVLLKPWLKERRARWTGSESLKHVPSAIELSEAGLRFKVNTESDCLLDLYFSERVLEIPQLKVDDWTERKFRNMLALEQCHYPHESYITEYVLVLDYLVNTSRDVDILLQNGVLVNWLGDTNSVANLINSLGKNITHSNFNSHYSRLCQDLNAFYRNPWHNLKSTLRRDYFRSPWQTAASIAAIVLLILSLVQTVCSVLQVIQQ